MEGADIIKIIALGLLTCYLAFLIINLFKVKNPVLEGLTNKSKVPSGEAGGSEQYAADLKTEVIKLQDLLLTSKYRNDYEDIILSLDDYMNLMMLKALLNMDPSSGDDEKNMNHIDRLNKLNGAKKALETTMKYLDST